MDTTHTALAEGLARFLEASRPASRDVRIANVRQFFGGSSKPTYRADIHDRGVADGRPEPIVIRLTPRTGLVDHSQDMEAQVLRLLNMRGYKVPEVRDIVSDPAVLGAPFFIMEEITGCETAQHLLQTEPYASHRNAIGVEKWRLLGTLAGFVLTEAECALFPPVTVDTAWLTELNTWASYYRAHAQEPEPLVDRALRWLRRNPPPPPAKLSFVHGDYRTGNFLFNGAGEIRGILDWEMAHIGDPHEDIAWAICPSWGWADHDRPGALITRAEAFAVWQQASGLRIDPLSLHWWSLFTTIKGVALWAACASNLRHKTATNSVEIAACWFPRDVHLRLMAQLLFAEDR